MTSINSIPVFIAGAGPTGLVLALVLLKNGIRVRIIDKDPKFHRGSRGAGIHPRTSELFNQLGLSSDIAKYSSETPLMRAYKMPGGTEPLKTWDIVEWLNPTPAAPINRPFIIGQDDLEEVLRSQIKPYGCEIEFGKELVSFEQDKNGVMVELRTILDGEETREIVRAEYLVGADGARGVVRKLLNLSFLGETRETEAILVTDIEVFNLDRKYWHVWEDSKTKFLVRPTTPEGKIFQFACIFKDYDPKNVLEPEQFKSFFRKSINRPELEFGEVKWYSYFQPKMRMVDKFGEGRVFVAGDAAHVHPPSGGQGLNSGVQDSINLAWKLALSIRGIASPTLLDSYTEERLPVIAEMLRQTTGLYTTEFVGESEKETGRKEWNRPVTLFMLGINYRWSSIVLDERTERREEDKDLMKAHSYGGYKGKSLCAGDRAPDAPNLIVQTSKSNLQSGEEISLFQILNPTKHTLLIFVNADDEGIHTISHTLDAFPQDTMQSIIIIDKNVGSSASIVGADFVVLDREGHARRSYMIEEKLTVIIIRPDSYVGGVLKNVENIKAYTPMIFR